MTRATETHQHTAATTQRDLPYTGCVDAHRCTESAHGNARDLETCDCGATRETLRNGGHVERGMWRVAVH